MTIGINKPSYFYNQYCMFHMKCLLWALPGNEGPNNLKDVISKRQTSVKLRTCPSHISTEEPITRFEMLYMFKIPMYEFCFLLHNENNILLNIPINLSIQAGTFHLIFSSHTIWHTATHLHSYVYPSLRSIDTGKNYTKFTLNTIFKRFSPLYELTVLLKIITNNSLKTMCCSDSNKNLDISIYGKPVGLLRIRFSNFIKGLLISICMGTTFGGNIR